MSSRKTFLFMSHDTSEDQPTGCRAGETQICERVRMRKHGRSEDDEPIAMGEHSPSCQGDKPAVDSFFRPGIPLGEVKGRSVGWYHRRKVGVPEVFTSHYFDVDTHKGCFFCVTMTMSSNIRWPRPLLPLVRSDRLWWTISDWTLTSLLSITSQ